MSEIKTAAVLCTGCGIGEALDLKELARIAQKEGKIGVLREDPQACSAASVAALHAEIQEQGLTHLLIAGCSRRAKTEAFNFPGLALARCNWREGVLWSVPEGENAPELRQEMAADYLRMGCAELKKLKLPQANPKAAGNRRILVLGGGASGLTAALAAADMGHEAVIVEIAPQLGGWAAQWWRRTPWRAPYAVPQPTGIDELVRRAADHPLLRCHLGATVLETRGAPGRFSVDIATADQGQITEEVGAIIQATGFTPYPIERLPELGGGMSPWVIDQAGLESLARASDGAPIRRGDGRPVRTVVFIQCAGQRDATGRHLAYCSGHCCATSVKQAMYFKAAQSDVDTVVLYTDLRLPGMGEDFYRSAQTQGVTFVKGEAKAVTPQGEGLRVAFRDLILDTDSAVEADLVVLATGQVPRSGTDIDLPEEERAVAAANSVLKLAYRQGPDLPQLKYGFTDSHFICFPYETRRTGIYSAGPVRRPMDLAQAMEDATGAALKAIQAVESAAQGRALHPRSGDLSYPMVRLEGCTQCKRCTVECPFGAIDEDENRYPVFNESRCRRCGTCMGACPVRVISFENYSVDTVGSQIKSIDMPDEFSEKPRVLVLACENDAYPALDTAAMQGRRYSAFVRVIPVRCLGSVNTIWITDALNGGWDGVMLLGCKKGEDYQCHFVRGSEMAAYRLSKIEDTLKQMGLEPERVATYEVAITDVERLPRLIDEYVAKMFEIGMSPMKGFA
ncbi:MAG: hydrogenase iron-sulfur subunit [Betaproteobacteria bacterium]|nr:hydrogenase iron-sulfur subunit [Betaproteobacteria bacterium]